MSDSQPSLAGLCFATTFTRQFLPGYSHSRLAALRDWLIRSMTCSALCDPRDTGDDMILQTLFQNV